MEEDGMDETILPVDHSTAGQIRDTGVWAAIKQLLPGAQGVGGRKARLGCAIGDTSQSH